jgi:hypothetical protein
VFQMQACRVTQSHRCPFKGQREAQGRQSRPRAYYTRNPSHLGFKDQESRVKPFGVSAGKQPPHPHITGTQERRVIMSVIRSIWQSMYIYRVPNIKDPRALSSRTSMGEPAEERPARDRERCTGSIENRSPLPAFFRPWAGRPVFRGSSRGF